MLQNIKVVEKSGYDNHGIFGSDFKSATIVAEAGDLVVESGPYPLSQEEVTLLGKMFSAGLSTEVEMVSELIRNLNSRVYDMGY